jgi:hypothetical protein
MGLYFNGRLLALPVNIELGWKQMAVANEQTYYDTATITAIKSFKIQASDGELLRLANKMLG